MAKLLLFQKWRHINNVMLKLARGHAAFELSKLCRKEPDHFWCSPLILLTQEEQETFNAAHFPHVLEK